MAKIPQVEHFLFCYSLRTGILFFSTVAVLFQFVQLLILAFTYDTTMMQLSSFDGGSGPYAQGAAFGLATGLANMTLCVLLIIGVLYKKPGFFLPWLAVSGFSIAVLALGLILVVILMPIYLSYMPALTAGVFFLVLFIMGWCMHLFCVVHTYYKQLKEPEKVDLRLEIADPVKIPYNALA